MSEYAFKGTPFHGCTAKLNQTTWWYSWGGYVVPDVYTDIHTELDAIRTNVSMNEMSPLPKMKISGRDAHRFVNYLITRDAGRMEPGHACYTPWCNEQGKVVADGIVFRFEEDLFVLSGDNSISFFQQYRAGFDVEIENITDDYGILALQGPNSRAVLEAASDDDWSDLKFSRIRKARIKGVELNVARQGFTGELGYELWVRREDGEKIWKAIETAGKTFAIQPAGEYAIDIARVEAGLVLVSAEYTGAGLDEPSADVIVQQDDHITPFELGVGHCVNLDKRDDFLGKQALIAETKNGSQRGMVGLELDLNGIVNLFIRHGMAPEVSPRVRWDRLKVVHNGNQIGQASSVTWSPTAGKMIGFACVSKDLALAGIELTVQWKDFWGKELDGINAKVVEYPFIKLNRAD